MEKTTLHPSDFWEETLALMTKKKTEKGMEGMVAERRQRKRRLQQVRFVLGLIILFLLWAVTSLGRDYIRVRKFQGEYRNLETEIRALQMRNTELEKEILRMRSPDYVERVAREELGLIKPGEVLYILSEPIKP